MSRTHRANVWWHGLTALAHNVELCPVKNERDMHMVLLDGRDVCCIHWDEIAPGDVTDLVEALRRVAKERNEAREEVAQLKRLVCVQSSEMLRLDDGWGPCLVTREDRRAIDAIVEEERGIALARSAMAAAVEKAGGTR